MFKQNILLFLIWVFLLGETTTPLKIESNGNEQLQKEEKRFFADKAYRYLYKVMDQYHDSFYVYADADSGGNHFTPSGWMGDIRSIKFDGAYSLNPQSGSHYIKISYKPQFFSGHGWAGIYWLFPENNWGEKKGFDLTGATELSFWARGEKGGEKAEFKVGGVNCYPYHDPKKPYQDSLGPITTGVITLSKEWKEYRISLAGHSLKNVIGGFCWVTNIWQNPKGCTIYIDNVRYNLAKPDELRFLNSFQTTSASKDKYLRNVGFTYDNSLVLLAFLARSTKEDLRRAKILADSFIYAQNNDRYFKDGRLRNAYQSGDLIDYETGKAGLPGWWVEEDKKWYEDKVFVGSSTGNLAWAIIALISYYEVSGDKKYLESAEKLGHWIEKNCRDERGAGGYNGGYEGWEPNQTKLFWKSTEHNLDAYVAFKRLYFLTNNLQWKKAFEHAKKFLDSMWNNKEGFFWTGTFDDGITINKQVIPLDTQTWGLLALKENKYISAIRWAERNCYVISCPKGCRTEGFDFNTDKDGVWYEGTSQMAVAYAFIEENDKFQHLLEILKAEQEKSKGGGLSAACHDGVTTGFEWEYFRRLHIGATAWAIMAERRVNPYWDMGIGEERWKKEK